MFKKCLQKATKSLQPVNKLKPLEVSIKSELFKGLQSQGSRNGMGISCVDVYSTDVST